MTDTIIEQSNREPTTRRKRRSSIRMMANTTTTQQQKQRIHTIPPMDETIRPKKNVHFQIMDYDEMNDDVISTCSKFSSNVECNNDENDTDCHSQQQNGQQDIKSQHTPFELTTELCERLWYSTKEINDMKQETRQVLLNRNSACKDDLVGLERFTAQRAIWKRSSIQYVLLAQKRKPNDVSFIQRVSLRCSGYAREMAIKQGFKDFCAVYDPLKSLFDDVDVENYNDCFFSDNGTPVVQSSSNNVCGTKRKSMDELEQETKDADDESSSVSTPERRVRQRITPVAVKVDEDSESFPVIACY